MAASLESRKKIKHKYSIIILILSEKSSTIRGGGDGDVAATEIGSVGGVRTKVVRFALDMF